MDPDSTKFWKPNRIRFILKTGSVYDQNTRIRTPAHKYGVKGFIPKGAVVWNLWDAPTKQQALQS